MNKKINGISDEIAKIIRELLETTEENAKEIIYKYLNRTSGTFDYQNYQAIQLPQLKLELQDMINDAIINLEQAVENSKKITEYDTARIKEEIQRKTKQLYVSALRQKNVVMRRIVRSSKTTPLRQAIFNQTQIGLDSAMRIRTKRGSMGYKEYMEMSVRTTMANELGEEQLKFNKQAKVVFYISNVFKDSAGDHADYQGKYYYDERYRSFNLKTDLLQAIDQRINQLKMLSVQQVRDGEPYLTTRPNCRHRLTPVSIKKVLENAPKELFSSMKLTDGSYKAKNYDLSQEQRKNERLIRKYKARKEQNLKLYEQTNEEQYLAQSRKDNFLMRKWQAKQRQLIRANPQLERDYRRETKNIIVRDLGVRYNQAR